jgi:flagellar hook assembly protein FlgD
LPGAAFVTLKVYDVNGQLIKMLANTMQNGGLQEIVWDATDESGIKVGSGSYLYELTVNPADMGSGFSAFTKRNVMMVVK